MDIHEGRLTPISMDAVRTCPPYGIYLLAAILRQHGHDVVIIDLIAQGSKDLSLHWRHLLSSHLIGIGTSSLSWPTARDVITEIRAYLPYVPIVLGGIHATMFDAYLMNTTAVNFVIRGEGEKAFPLLCETLTLGGDLRAVPNLTFRTMSGKIVRNQMMPPLTEAEMERAPVPDYAALPSGVYTGLGIESSRGCPFDCAFCSTSHRKSWRGVAPRCFADRVERILPYTQRTQKGLLQIIDDEFSLKTDRAIEICNEFGRRNMNVDIVFDARANDLSKDAFLTAIAPYAHQFLVGAECGYDEGLKRIGKGTTTKRLEDAARALRKYDMAGRADFSFIIGLPWETREDVLETVHFAFHLYETFGVRVLLQWYCQIPGSRLWDAQRQKEILHEAFYDNYGFFRNHYLFRTGVGLSPSEVHNVYETINALQTLSTKNINGMDMIQSSVPEPILQFFPKYSQVEQSSSLANLRDAAGLG